MVEALLLKREVSDDVDVYMKILLLHKQQPADMGYIHDWVTQGIDRFEKRGHRVDHTWRLCDNVLWIFMSIAV